MLAGPNGSGKTTCAQGELIHSLIVDVRFLNPDYETLLRLRALGYEGFHDAPKEVQLSQFIASANDVSQQLSDSVDGGEEVGIETVLSTDKYLTLVEDVRAAGGDFVLIFVVVNTPELACERVALRAAKRGHSVPSDKIHDRWYKSIQNLPKFAALAKAFWVFDNSNSDPDLPPVRWRAGSMASWSGLRYPALNCSINNWRCCPFRPKRRPGISDPRVVRGRFPVPSPSERAVVSPACPRDATEQYAVDPAALVRRSARRTHVQPLAVELACTSTRYRPLANAPAPTRRGMTPPLSFPLSRLTGNGGVDHNGVTALTSLTSESPDASFPITDNLRGTVVGLRLWERTV